MSRALIQGRKSLVIIYKKTNRRIRNIKLDSFDSVFFGFKEKNSICCILLVVCFQCCAGVNHSETMLQFFVLFSSDLSLSNFPAKFMPSTLFLLHSSYIIWYLASGGLPMWGSFIKITLTIISSATYRIPLSTDSAV